MGQIKHGAWLSRAMPRYASAFALVVGLICAVFVSGTHAQEATPKKKQIEWFKLCGKVQVKDGSKKEACVTHYERRHPLRGIVLVSVGLRTIEGQDKKRFLILLPLGMVIPAGVQIRFDKDTKPYQLNFLACTEIGCNAEVNAPPELVEKMRKGNEMMVRGTDIRKGPFEFRVPLFGISRTLDGPPIDNKLYADAQRKFMLSVQKRQIERNKQIAEQKKKKKQQQNAQ